MKSLTLVVVFVVSFSCSTVKPIAESKYNNDREILLSSYKIAYNQLHKNKASMIDLAISRRLSSLGYTQNEKPSFFIYYQIIESPSRIKRLLNSSSETLIISFYDPNKQEEIWKGTLPGIDSKTPRSLLFAVNTVMDDFDVLSQKITARNLY